MHTKKGGFMRAVCVLCPCAPPVVARRAPLFNNGILLRCNKFVVFSALELTDNGITFFS